MYFLLTKNENDPLSNLGNENLTQVRVTSCKKDFLPLNDTESVALAIREIIKIAKNS